MTLQCVVYYCMLPKDMPTVGCTAPKVSPLALEGSHPKDIALLPLLISLTRRYIAVEETVLYILSSVPAESKLHAHLLTIASTTTLRNAPPKPIYPYPIPVPTVFSVLNTHAHQGVYLLWTPARCNVLAGSTSPDSCDSSICMSSCIDITCLQVL